jgi:hypothetical protein
MTEPFFVNMTNGYTETLVNFMKKKWVSFVILGGSLVLTYGII